MNPSYFTIDPQNVQDALTGIVILALVVERSLALFINSSFFIENIEYKVSRGEGKPGDKKSVKPIVNLERKSFRGLKELIAFATAFGVCHVYKFDALAIILPEIGMTHWMGEIVTAGAIAGGSQGAIKLFQDWADWSSSARKEVNDFKKAVAEGAVNTAEQPADEAGKGK